MRNPIAEQNDLLERAFKQRRFVSFKARHWYSGFVIGLSDDLVLVHDFHYQLPDGYTVVQRADIVEVQSSLDDDERELRFFESVIIREGTIARVGLGFSIPLGTMAAAAGALVGQAELVMFDRGNQQPPDDGRHVGSVLSADDLRIRTRCITDDGEWLDGECEQITAHIEYFRFGYPDLRTRWKYRRQ